jgi:uncharacterized membrane protein YccC
LAGCAVLLLLTTPFLANYALMNLALFLVLFAFGFLTARIAGINFWMQVAFLTISAFVGLNPQEPVASQTIINTFLGLMFGIWTATVVGRLIWPVLPQYVLRDDLLGLCGRLQALLNREPHREKIQAQLAVLPLEALQAVGQLRMAGCSGEERTRLAALVRGLQMLVTRMSQLVSRRALLREMVEPRLRLEFDCLDVEFKQVLEAFGACFRQGRCPLPALQGALAGLDQAVQRGSRPAPGCGPDNGRSAAATAGAGRSIPRHRRGAGGVRPLAGQPAAPALLGRLRLVFPSTAVPTKLIRFMSPSATGPAKQPPYGS